MWVLRALLIVEFVACLLLYSAKTFGWEAIDEAPAMVWVFLFAYPGAVLVFIPAVVLFISDVIHFRRRAVANAIGWISFDVVLPILSFLFFWAYYEQIGHM